MRTAIYVQQPSTVTIRPTDPRDAKALLCRYNQLPEQAAAGTHKLQPGIYLVISSGPIEVHGLGTTTQIVANDKDIWPDPKATVIGLEPGATAASIQEFFTVAKDISPED
jgi:hypothetical protein